MTVDSSGQLSGPLWEMLDFASDIRERIFASTLRISNSLCVFVRRKRNGLLLNWHYFEARNSMPLVRKRWVSAADLGAVINLSLVSSDVIAVVHLLTLAPGRVSISTRNWFSSALVETEILAFILLVLDKWSTRSSLTEKWEEPSFILSHENGSFRQIFVYWGLWERFWGRKVNRYCCSIPGLSNQNYKSCLLALSPIFDYRPKHHAKKSSQSLASRWCAPFGLPRCQCKPPPWHLRQLLISPL